MSDPNSAENSSGKSKKGLSPLAWVGIGCGGLLVLGLIAVVAGGMILGNKVKQGLADANGNPERFAAELVVKFNPDMELVESNDEEGKITIKMTKTGEVHTFSYADLKDGKFSVESTTADGKTTSVKHDGQTMKIDDGEGKTTTVTASQKGNYWANLPTHFKDFVYPGVGDVASPLTVSEDDKAIKASFIFTTKDKEEAVLKFYQDIFAAGSYTVEDKADLMGKGLHGSKDKKLIKVTVTTQGDNETVVMFSAELAK